MSDVEQKEDERQRGARGEIGVATASLTIKQRYHEAFFKRVDAGNKNNPTKKVWVKSEGAPSLKQFARKLLASGDANIKEWFANKNGAKDQHRSDANIKAAREAAAATKVERRKRSAGNNNSKK
jgi:hypothetical protein